MVSAIDATKPLDGVPAVKGDLRANLATTKSEIEGLQTDVGVLQGKAGANDLIFNALSPEYGVVADGVTDDSAGLNAAIAATINSSSVDGVGAVLVIPPGRYRIDSGLVIPKTTRRSTFKISGYGAELLTFNPIAMMSREDPVDNTEALSMTAGRFTIEGLRLLSDGTATYGLRMNSTYGTVLQDVEVTRALVGFDLRFCLNTQTYNCYASNCTNKGFVARNGDWTGVTLANSQSNVSRFSHCRVGCTAAQAAGFEILGASGVVLDSCITEGNDPVNAVFFDDLGSTVVKDFTVIGHHAENRPSGCHFKIKLANGIAKFDGIFTQLTNVLLIDAADCANGARIVLDDLLHVPAGTTLKANSISAPTWRIGQRGNHNIDWFDSANWEGGIVGFIFENSAQLGVGAHMRVSSLMSLQASSAITLTSGSQGIHLSGALRTDQSAAATTLGTVTGKIEIKDISGTIVGYLPLYDAIT